MMNAEFIRKMIGKPWVNRASSFECCDCWGLVMLYYKEVLGITIPEVKGFADNDDFNDCYEKGITPWETVPLCVESGLMFTAYKGNIPTHVGICIGGGKVLHSRGVKVEIHSISSIESVYGKITFHRFKGLSNA